MQEKRYLSTSITSYVLLTEEEFVLFKNGDLDRVVDSAVLNPADSPFRTLDTLRRSAFQTVSNVQPMDERYGTNTMPSWW